jgi:hypothetical protein
MRTIRITAIFLLVALLASLAPVASAAETVALRVVTVKTSDPAAYARELEAGRAIFKRLGSQVIIRSWRARFAGEGAGLVVVSLEFPSLVALATDDAKIAADPEAQAWLKGLDKVRTVVSDSIYQEVKP